MTLHVTSNDPMIEQTVLQALQARGATVVLLEGGSAPTEAPEPPQQAPRATRRRRVGPLSVREYVSNVMGISTEPLTTREITAKANEMKGDSRKPISSRAVYNVLYRAAKDGNMVHLANGTWQRLPIPVPGVR